MHPFRTTAILLETLMNKSGLRVFDMASCLHTLDRLTKDLTELKKKFQTMKDEFTTEFEIRFACIEARNRELLARLESLSHLYASTPFPHYHHHLAFFYCNYNGGVAGPLAFRTREAAAPA